MLIVDDASSSYVPQCQRCLSVQFRSKLCATYGRMLYCYCRLCRLYVDFDILRLRQAEQAGKDVMLRDGWLRGTVGRTSVFDRRTFPFLRSTCS